MKKFVGATLLGMSIALAGCSTDRTDVEYLDTAKGLYDSGNLQGATIELKNALKINSSNDDARVLLGKIYLEKGDGFSALKEFEKAKEIDLTNNLNALVARGHLITEDNEKVLELVEGNLSAAELNDLRTSKGMAYLNLEQGHKALKLFKKVLGVDSAHAYALLGVAHHHFAEDDLQAARAQVDEVLELDSNYAQAWSLLGAISKAEGDLEKSEEAYSRAIKLSHNDFEDTVSRALVRVGLDKIDEAEADLNSVRSPMSEHPSVYYARGLVHLRRQDFDLAQASFEKVLNASGDYLPALFYSGVSHASLDQPQMAEDKLSRYVAKIEDFPPANHMLASMRFESGDYQEAEKLLKDVIKQGDSEEAVYGLLSDTLMAQGKRDEAHSLLRDLVKQRPGSAQARLLFANVQAASGDMPGALKTLEDAIAIDDKFAEGYAQLVSLHLSQGAGGKAIDAANRFIRQSEGSISSYNLLASVYLNLNDDEQAKAAFAQALAIDANDASANGGMAAIAVKNASFEEALKFYKAILAENPGDLKALLNVADVNMARNNTAAAREAVEKAVAENPRSLEPRIRLGWFYAKSGDEDKIPELLSGFQRRYPDHVPLLVLLADSAYKTRNYSEAERHLLRLRELAPENAGIAYSLARTHAAKKNNREYLDALGEVIGIDPDDTRARVELANYLVVLDKLSEAQEHVDYLNRSIAGSAEVLLLEGKIAEKKGDFIAAVTAYAPIYNHTQSSLNLIRLSNAQWLAGQRSEVLKSLENWLLDNPADVVVQMELAARYLTVSKYDNAIALYEKVLKTDSDNVLAMNNLAWILKDADNERALQLAESAYKQQPRSPEIMDTLAQVLEARGASDDLQRAQRLRERAGESKPGG